MLADPHPNRYCLHGAGLTSRVANSSFAKYRTAETAVQDRMRRQREARLQQPQGGERLCAEIPFIRSVRFPERWTNG